MADPKKIGAKITSVIKAAGEEADVALAAERALKAEERASAGRRAADVHKATAPMKMSEALGSMNLEGKGKYRVTQSDRTRVGGGNIGGAMFPGLQHVDPFYEGAVWGVGDRPTASRLINQSDENTLWTTLLGSADQLKTNPLVFNKLRRGFVDSMKQGNLSDELAEKINHNLALTFGEGADIRDPKIWQRADTFEKRAALADVMMGQGIAPSKGGVALGGEKSGKGVIFQPSEILKRETEPLLLHPEHGGDVPTFSVGPRLFTLSGEVKNRPDLHPGFPYILQGEDKGVVFRPAPSGLALRDYTAEFKRQKKRSPSYYDLTMGEKGKGLPSQDITEDYLTFLQKEGYKKGGAIDKDAMHKRLKEKIEQMEKGHVRLAHRSLRKASGGAVGGPVGQTDDNTMPDLSDGGQTLYAPKYDVGGGVSKVSRAVGKATKEAENILAARRGQQAVLPAAESAANLEKMLAQSKEKRRMYHGTYRKPQVIHKQTGTEKPLTEYDWQGNVVTAKPMPEIPEEGLTSIMPGQRRGMIFTSPDPEFASSYARGPSLSPLEGGQVYPVRVHTKNPFDYENAEHVKAVADAIPYGSEANPLSIARQASHEDMLHALRTGDWSYIEDPEVLSAIRRLGFDGAYMRESNTKNLGVFRPEQVKSDIGNRGTYDIADPDITKASGGEVQLEMAGGGISKISKAIAKATEEAEAIAPVVNRIDMNYKDVTKRVPELTEAAQKVARGEMSPIEYDRIVNQFKPVMPYGFVPQPATYDDAMRALNEAKRPMFGKAGEIATGEQTDLRLDIPAYKDHGVWVNSIHRKDAPTVYGSVSAVKNATMIGSPDKAMKVATGETAKAPFAVIRGEWNPMDEQTAVKNAQKYLKHKDWRQVGYDPERHGYFYDRTTMEPILGAEEVIQIGPLVLAKKPRYGAKAEQKFDEGGAATMNPMLARQGAKWRQTHDYNPERQELIGQILARKAKEQAREEVESLKKPGATKDLLVKGVGAGLLGMPSDLINLGLQGVDFMVSDAGRKPVGFQLGSDRPFLGSEHLKELAQEYGLASETERPMMETGLSLINPGALVGAVKAAPKAVRAGESALNTAAAAARRPFTPATLTVEAVAPDLAKNLPREWQQTVTRSLTGEGAPVSMDVMGGRKTVKRPGQGVYENFAGDLETNPLVAVDVPRAGSLSGNKALRADIATAGQELAQESMAAHRFVPMATNQIKDASAMLIRTPEGLTNEQVIALGERLPGMIVAHNPRLGGVVVMPFEYNKGQIPGEFLDAQAVAHELLGKQANFRYGKADPVRDRLYMERQDYLTEGARPPSAAATEMRARLKQGERRMFPAPSQSSTRRRGALESAATTAH
jgi:hypothetical protein